MLKLNLGANDSKLLDTIEQQKDEFQKYVDVIIAQEKRIEELTSLVNVESIVKTFKAPTDAISWAIGRGLSEYDAQAIMNETETDLKGKRAYNFVRNVLKHI